MIFISGATGFLGSTIVKALVNRGEKLVAIKRKSSNLRFLKGFEEKLSWIEGDINDVSSLEQAMTGCSKVIHCAAAISLSPKDRDLMYKVNVEGTANMVNIALNQGVEKFIHLSSVAALPALENQEIDENSVWFNKPYPSSYGLTKFLAEREVQRGIAEGLNVVILNPSSIIGPCDWHVGCGLFFVNMYQGLPFYTEGTGGFVDVKDVAEIAILCMDSDLVKNEKFIVSAENISYQDFFGLIATFMKKKRPGMKLNKTVGRIAVILDAIKSYLTNSERMVTNEALQMANIKTKYNNTKVVKMFNYRFIPIEETVEKTTLEFLENINIKKKKQEEF